MKFCLVFLILHSCYGNTRKWEGNPPKPEVPATATILLTDGQVHEWTRIHVWLNNGDGLIVEGRLGGVIDAERYDGCDVEMIIVEPAFDEPLTCTKESES